MAYSDYVLFPCSDPDTDPVLLSVSAKKRFPIKDSGPESGNQQRLMQWTRPLMDFQVTLGCGREQWELLNDFLGAHRLGVDAFLFRDPFNNTVVKNAFGTGTGSASAFQLKTVNAYSSKSHAWNARMIDLNSELIYLNDVLRTTAYTIDNETGIVTFSAPLPGAGVVLTNSFDYCFKVVASEQPEYPHSNPNACEISMTLHEVV